MRNILSMLLPAMFRQNAFVLLLVALVVATMTVVSISVFVERISNTLYDEASQFIAADARISGSKQLESQWRHAASQYDVNVADLLSFSAMAFAGEKMQLAQIKAVSADYPLRGALTIYVEDTTQERIVARGPERGELWLAPRLVAALSIAIGDTVRVGEAQFTVTAVIKREPDSTTSMFGFAPRAMIHYEDVAATNAVQPGSRVNYATLFAGDKRDILALKKEIEPSLGEHHRWVTPEEGNAAFSATVRRAKQFLLLAGSLSVLLAGTAIALSAHRFALAQHSQVALLKTLGLSPHRIQTIYLTLLVGVGLLGFALGSVFGFAVHHALVWVLGDLLPDNLAHAGAKAYVTGAMTTLISLFAFAAPPLFSLKSVSPSRILRQRDTVKNDVVRNIAIGMLASVFLIGLYSLDLMITAILTIGLCLCVGASAIATLGLLAVFRKAQGFLHGPWRLGLSNLQRQRHFTALQIFVFATVGMLALILFQVRTSLVEQWEPKAEQAPNHFAFNIFDDELDRIRGDLASEDVVASAYYPMFRGRLIRVNEIAVNTIIAGDKQNREYERELNLTWASTLGGDNKIVEGQWWPVSTEEQLEVSIEEEYAAGLGVRVGDMLEFSIAGQNVKATVASIRQVQWDSMNPNFYVIFNRSAGSEFAVNWVTSFYLPPDRKALLHTLSANFPTVSFVELDQTLDVIKGIVAKVSRAIEFILVLVLVAALLVMLTSIQATLAQRRNESALLRSFGAQTRFVQHVMVVEFISIGALAGIFACIGAEFCLYMLKVRLFDLPFSPHWPMWFIAPVIIMVFIVGVGALATWSTMRIAPLRVLQNISDA